MKKAQMIFASTGTILLISFFLITNILTSPHHLWFIYPAFPMLWWPLSIIAYRKKTPLLLAISGTILSICFFSAINYITSPGTIWAIYPAFGILWWPLGLFFFSRKKSSS